MKNKNPGLKPFLFTTALTALLPASLLVLAGCAVATDATNEVEVPKYKKADAAQQMPTGAMAPSAGFSQYLRGVVADVSGDEDMAAAAYDEGLAKGVSAARIGARALEKHLILADVDAAIKVAKQLENAESDTLLQWTVLMVDALKNDKPEAAAKYLTSAQVHLPELVQFRLIQAYMSLRSGTSMSKALKALEGAEINTGYLARLSYHRGRMLLSEGQLAPAASALEDAHKLEPGALFTARLLAKVYSEANRIDDADAVYEAFKAKHPQALLLTDVTTEEFLAYERDMASSSLQHDTAETLFGLSVLLWAQGAEAPARQFMALALHLWPDEDFMPYYAGVLAESANQYDLAAEYYMGMLATPGLRLAGASRLAAVRAAEEDYAAARNVLTSTLGQFPGNDVLLAQLAQVHEATKNYRAAISVYDDMLTGIPIDNKARRAQILFARGAAWERLKHYISATKDLQLSLELAPDNPMVMNYLGYMWVDAGMHLEEGLKLLQAAHKLAPDSPALLDSLGWAYYKTEQYAQALLYVQRAVTAMPEDGVLRSHLGDIYAALGNQNEARKHWELALEFGLDSAREAKHVKEQLGL